MRGGRNGGETGEKWGGEEENKDVLVQVDRQNADRLECQTIVPIVKCTE